MKHIFNLITLVVISVFLINCKPKQTTNTVEIKKSSAIINGTPVTADQVLSKSVVGLLMNYEFSAGNKFWMQGCTGSVLNQKFILTAAHCVNGSPAADLAIHFSLNSFSFEKQLDPKTRITDLEKFFTVRKVKSYLQHPLYDGSGKHDLALILLESDVPADAVPVQILPDQFIDLVNNQTTFEKQNVDVVLMGFGLISESPRTETDVLRMTTVPATFENQFIVTDQTKGSGGCNGDSGGPAFFTFENITYQVGVTHGPHAGSTTCHEQGEWVNPALNKDFLAEAQTKLLSEK